MSPAAAAAASREVGRMQARLAAAMDHQRDTQSQVRDLTDKLVGLAGEIERITADIAGYVELIDAHA